MPSSQAEVQLSFAPLVKQVAPAVVNIYTKRVVAQRNFHPFLNDPFFSRFFGQQGMSGMMRERIESSLGSGVIVDAEGLVVTNSHVINGADEITVALNDGREFDAELVLEDSASDLALLRINPPGGEALPFASLRPSENLEVGDLVLAIGNPFGVGQTVTSGIVSAQGRSNLNINDFNFFIQTDAAINPGNSGGPLITLDGKVVGINTAIYSRDGGSMGLGFAVPSEMVASVIAAVKDGRTGARGVMRPWIGVSVQEVTSDIAESLNLNRPRGALVTALHPESPMGKAGIKVGDLITAIDGREIRDAGEMRFRMATVAIGTKTNVTYQRDGKEQNVKIEAILPPEKPARAEVTLCGQHIFNGATISNINPAVMVELHSAVQEGVIITDVEPRTYAARFLRPGDVILSINNAEISNTGDVQRALKTLSANGVKVILNRSGQVSQIIVR